MARMVTEEVPPREPREAERTPAAGDGFARQWTGVGRLGTVAAWLFAVCCLPYLGLKVVWTLDLPVGIAEWAVLERNGWMAANALMAMIQLVGLLLVLALTQPWARRIPAWLLLVPVWFGTGLLFQIVGAVLLGLFAPLAPASRGSTGGIQPWVFVLVYAGFTGQGVALALAFAAHVRARWGWLLDAQTGAVVARPTAGVRSWSETHRTTLAVAVAALAVAVALVYGYWAAGGSFGLSGTPLQPPWELQASRVAGAVTAAVGLLGLAGRWGQRTRFWLPATLAWVGSGALAAFDGFTLGLNQLFLLFGTGVSVPAWSLTDTVQVLKVVIGVVAGAVCALALTAANDTQKQARV